MSEPVICIHGHDARKSQCVKCYKNAVKDLGQEWVGAVDQYFVNSEAKEKN